LFRSRTLLSLVFAGCLLSPASVSAGAFAQVWTLSGWTYVQELGNTDSDVQRELLFASKVDGHYAIVDGFSGAVSKEFSQFSVNNTMVVVQDVDADGRPELFFWRPGNGPDTPLTTGYRWNGSSYVVMFSQTAAFENWGLANLRGAATYDAVEVTTNDVRVRSLSGALLFQASTSIPGWSGAALTMVSSDIDADGILELGIVEHSFTAGAKVTYLNYAGGVFAQAWAVNGWQTQGAVNSDGDPQPEIVMFNGADGHYGLFDGITGSMEIDFSGFSFYDGAYISAFDTDGDGAEEVFLQRNDNLPATTRFFTAYHWNFGNYSLMFSHTDPIDTFSFAHVRNASQYDVIEQTQVPTTPVGELRFRNLTGSVVFVASTTIPGWSGVNTFTVPLDTNHDGIDDLVVQDDAVLRCLRYNGATFVQPWTTAAWSLQTSFPNIDGDPQPELFAASAGDRHYALLDAAGGGVEQEFPAFTVDNGYLSAIDTDNDGRLELYFDQYVAPHQFTGYEWTPSGYTTLFSHNDPIEGFGNGHFRGPSTSEFMEFAPNDLRLRDLSGAVIFRASTDLPGWTGVNRDMQAVDLAGNGVSQFLAIDSNAARLVQYTGTTSATLPGLGGGLRLLGNVPNPFRTATTFRFSTRSAGEVSIRVFDAAGRMVRRLAERMPAGMNEVRWDGRDERGNTVPSGILFYEVTADGMRQSGRVVRLGR
jgi:hypothetical protein